MRFFFLCICGISGVPRARGIALKIDNTILPPGVPGLERRTLRLNSTTRPIIWFNRGSTRRGSSGRSMASWPFVV